MQAQLSGPPATLKFAKKLAKNRRAGLAKLEDQQMIASTFHKMKDSLSKTKPYYLQKETPHAGEPPSRPVIQSLGLGLGLRLGLRLGLGLGLGLGFGLGLESKVPLSDADGPLKNPVGICGPDPRC